MYKPPYTVAELKKYYPEKAEALLNDPVHFWRATTGIELIHQEPTLEEQKRIWQNWQEMSEDLKLKSEAKSLELFGMNNFEHHKEIMQSGADNK